MSGAVAKPDARTGSGNTPAELIRAKLAEIEAKRSAMPPEERAELERREIEAQRESWVRAMGPCEHGVLDFEDCAKCRRAGEQA